MDKTNNYIIFNSVSDIFDTSYNTENIDTDVLVSDYHDSCEELESLETFYNIYDFNTRSKLNMLDKINKAYGPCNRGIENYCRIQSLEAEESTPDSSSTNNQQIQSSNNNAPTDKSKTQKLVEFLKKIHESIANVFNKLIEWILNLINKFRYSNKVFEGTINSINNAKPEELNKLSDDLKTVEFESKGILEVSKHPTENLNKHLSSLDIVIAVFENAIASANTNPKDTVRIKDFSVKLFEFANKIPEIGKSCPKLESDGNESLKQYYTSLKTYCSSSLNYNKNMSPFNKSLANSETLDGKLTVIKIIGSIDPKAIINTIKSENDSVGKINELLSKNKEKFNKASKDITALLRKYVATTDKQVAESLNSQIQSLLAMEKAVVQLNSIYSGICSNVIKSINLVKGKLIDMTKKNIKSNNESDKSNATDSDNNTEK